MILNDRNVMANNRRVGMVIPILLNEKDIMTTDMFFQILPLPMEVIESSCYKKYSDDEINDRISRIVNSEGSNREYSIGNVDDRDNKLIVYFRINDVLNHTTIEKELSTSPKFLCDRDDYRVHGFVYWKGFKHYLISTGLKDCCNSSNHPVMYRLSPTPKFTTNETHTGKLTWEQLEMLMKNEPNGDQQLFCS
jgi:hypothetical protein